MPRKRANERSDVVVAGYLGVDLTPRFRADDTRAFTALFRPGRLIEMDGLDLSLGGAVANTGLALHRFGLRVHAMGLVGDDWLGDTAINILRDAGLGVAGITRKPQSGTAYGLVLAPAGTDRIFLEDPGCNRIFSSAHVDFATVARARLFHFGYPPLMHAMWTRRGAALRDLFRRVQALGVTTSLDLSLPDPASPAGKADWKAILATTLPYVDIFVPSIEELLFMLRPQRYSAAAKNAHGGDLIAAIPRSWIEELAVEALRLGARIVLIKCGPVGAYVRTRPAESGDVRRGRAPVTRDGWSDRSLWVAAQRVDPRRFVNACGAGDSAVAAFLTAFVRGESLERASAVAMRAGRDSLYGYDATSGLTAWSTMTARPRAR